MTTSELSSAVKLLNDATTVAVLCHSQPDADSIGSGFALALALDRLGVKVQVTFSYPDRLPASLDGIPGQRFLVAPEQLHTADLVVTVDCGSPDRVGRLQHLLTGDVLVIDHHASNTGYGSVNLVDLSASSTTAVIADLLDALGAPIDAEIAHCLYAGLVTDTGAFRWVNPGTHTLAERLLATGIDGAEISRELLDTHSFTWLHLVGRVLSSATFVPDAADGAGLVYAMATQEDLAGTAPEDAESLVDLVRTASEALVAAVLKERAPNWWTVSLRSRGGVEVSPIAVRLGGGGHRYAAGYSATGTAADVLRELLAELG
ncbi:DHH family phosphoesterase [Smaragdicoccus niigatensis]|uniref:DHH family phosphoesterase n=1 Tax=Smaragdicoccus niigatensis TaxID=359359 RepID=UPI00037381D6|nr:bifunctional oligoribonuclease/PAP phosphatase NrnA [Smaragdicoccus niigatensis]